MSILEIIFLCAGLSVDNMAVAAAAGCAGGRLRGDGVKTSAIFSAMSIICMVLGWLGGNKLGHIMGGLGHWAAAALLFFIGLKMLREALHCGQEACSCAKAPALSDVKTLALLALATNIDVFAAGISLALYNVSLISVTATLAVFVMCATMTGFALGERFGAKLGRRAELAGAVILIILSAKILIAGLI